MGFNDPAGQEHIGSETRSLENKESFDRGSFNDPSSMLPIEGKSDRPSRHTDRTQQMGYPDNAGITDGGHISG